MNIYEKLMVFYESEDLIKVDGYDDAVIGIDEHQRRLIYSQKKIIEIIMNDSEMNIDEAEEFFAYNIFNVYLGDHTPIYCLDNFNY